jgi:hypothetical protein
MKFADAENPMASEISEMLSRAGPHNRRVAFRMRSSLA